MNLPETKHPIAPPPLTTAPTTRDDTEHGSWLKRSLMAGTVASLLSAGMLALRGRREVRSASAPLNAPSHWLFGRSALHSDHLSLRHTLSGMLIHHGSSIFWALIYSRLLHRQRVQPTLGALLVSALAAWVDLRLVPERLTPGFERRLTHKSLVLVYAAFAFGLSLGGRPWKGRCGSSVRGGTST